MSRFRKCTKAEFDAFVMAYPRPLERHLCTIIEPELLQMCDFSLGAWPACVVAYFSTWGCDPNDMWAQVPGDWHILADPPEAPALTLAEARANLAPELELRELWDILAREGLEDRIETILLQRIEEWGP